jgi:hypothetical protein
LQICLSWYLLVLGDVSCGSGMLYNGNGLSGSVKWRVCYLWEMKPIAAAGCGTEFFFSEGVI